MSEIVEFIRDYEQLVGFILIAGFTGVFLVGLLYYGAKWIYDSFRGGTSNER